MIEKVYEFNEAIVGIDRKMGPMCEEEAQWFEGVLNEEKDEFKEAFDNGDFIGQVDAIVDTVYFAIGGLKRMGLPEAACHEIFDVIHGCNMNKVQGAKVERGFSIEADAVKPAGWEGPEERIAAILEKYKG